MPHDAGRRGPAHAHAPRPPTVTPGAAVTLTVTGIPGQNFAVLGSSVGAGLAYGGVNLAVGSDMVILAMGAIGGTGLGGRDVHAAICRLDARSLLRAGGHVGLAVVHPDRRVAERGAAQQRRRGRRHRHARVLLVLLGAARSGRASPGLSGSRPGPLDHRAQGLRGRPARAARPSTSTLPPWGRRALCRLATEAEHRPTMISRDTSASRVPRLPGQNRMRKSTPPAPCYLIYRLQTAIRMAYPPRSLRITPYYRPDRARAAVSSALLRPGSERSWRPRCRSRCRRQ